MTAIPTTDRAAELTQAAGRIEGWLLHSGVQVDDGFARGGIAGWLDAEGRPKFVYLEAAGYYLTAMAWLASGAACSPSHAEAARWCAHRTVRWVADLLSNRDPLPTRLYLTDARADWRNGAVFIFDLAMAARGVAASRDVRGRRERRHIIRRLCARIDEISCDADIFRSHEPLPGPAAVPDRWSTKPGPHHLKAAAAILGLPERAVASSLREVAQRTYGHWTAALATQRWPAEELHALLYGLEGVLIETRGCDRDDLRLVAGLFAELMELQAPDGALPETIHGGVVRSDVLAQALRVGAALRGRGYLIGSAWTDRLDGLTDALLGLLRPDGGVLFCAHQPISNTWCALFAHQALCLRARDIAGEPLPANTFEYLV